MKQDPTRSVIAPLNSPILLLAILVAPVLLSLLADSASFAQTGSAAAIDAPALTAEAGESAIELSWTAVSGAARYELWAWSTVGGWHRLDEGNLTGTSFRHGEVTAGTENHYAIRATAPDGAASAWSALASLTWGADRPTSTATPSVASAERRALAALYKATDGANWTRNDNWLSDQPISTWYGFTASDDKEVTELRISTNKLRGSIPDLSTLAVLVSLDLGENSLSGPVPDLSALTRLKELGLYDNELSGSVPSLGRLGNLKQANLSSNRLSGSIPDLGGLTGLTFL